ncbi:MAG TPA: J domain-containing protein [Spirochaetota bacterium]|nr:J domain-containing protein [Spirochaetota bacterium]
MDIQACYRLLEIPETASDEDLTKSYKRLALKFHPDRNPHRVEWATQAMASLNDAYTSLKGHRFRNARQDEPDAAPPEDRRQTARAARPRPVGPDPREELKDDLLVRQFVRHREAVKDAFYRYFQYNLYNLIRRENPINRGIFKEVTGILRRNYHAIRKLFVLTADRELLDHFAVFSEMVFNFYRASECLNIPDSYANLVDVEAFRIYKKGDDALHLAHRELFYDRHNRGFLKRDICGAMVLKAVYHFREALERYSQSTWVVETTIKLEYALSLKRYIELFFTEEDA